MLLIHFDSHEIYSWISGKFIRKDWLHMKNWLKTPLQSSRVTFTHVLIPSAIKRTPSFLASRVIFSIIKVIGNLCNPFPRKILPISHAYLEIWPHFSHYPSISKVIPLLELSFFIHCVSHILMYRVMMQAKVEN